MAGEFDPIDTPEQTPVTAPFDLEASIQRKLSVDPEIAASMRKNIIRDDAESAITRGAMRNPEEYARYVRLHEKTGYDPELLAEDPEVRRAAEQQDKVRSIDFDRIKEHAPVTTQWLTDPVNATVGQDDVENLSVLESAYSNTNKAFGAIREFAAEFATSTATGAYGAIASGLGLASRYYSQPVMDFLRRNNIDIGGFAPQGVDIFGIGEQKFLELQRGAQSTEKAISGRTGKEGFVESAVRSGFGSLGSATADFIVGRFNPQSTLALMTGKVYGDSYGEARAKGLESGEAATFAAAQATAEYVTERIPVKYLLGDEIFKKNLLKSFINFQIKEGGTEQIATAWQDFNEWAMLNTDKPFSAYMAERPQAALATAIATTISGGGQMALVGTVNKLSSRNLSVSKAFFDALNKGVTDSKLHKRLPEKTREFIKQVKETGEIKDVFIDAATFRKFFQDRKQDPNQAAKELLGEDGPKQLAEAESLGADFVIPLEVYAEKVAGTPIHESLVEDLRLRQGDMSINEAKLAAKNLTEEERQLAKTVADLQKQTEVDVSLKAVYDDIRKSAATIGVPPSQADVWATLVTERYRKRSALMGRDPLELYTETGALQLAREGMEPQEGAVTLNQGETSPFKGSVVQIPLYHGTAYEFGKFANGPVFFTDDPKAAGHYASGAAYDADIVDAEDEYTGHTFKVWLDLKNPASPDDVIAVAKEMGLDDYLADVEDGEQPLFGLLNIDDDYYIERGTAEELIDRLKAKGFDGVAGITDMTDMFREHSTWVAFDPHTQVMNADTMKLMQSAPLWYSNLSRLIENGKMEKGGGQQWKGYIKNLPGVRQEEIKWSGIEEWLDLTYGPITKQDIVEYINSNGVRVEEQFPMGESVVDDVPDWAEDAAHDQVVELWNQAEPTRQADSWVHLLNIAGDSEIDDNSDMLWILGQRRRILVEHGFSQPDSYKFERYQLPGGEDYKELVLQVPAGSIGTRQLAPGFEEELEFRLTAHYDLPNVLAHVRFNTRTDVNGKKVLFLEEIQSDWAQQGRKAGGFGRLKLEPYGDSYVNYEDRRVWPIKVKRADGEFDYYTGYGETFEEAAEDLYGSISSLTSNVPEGPFVQNTDAWVGLVTKRMIRYAAENGFDRIAWTTGQQQNARWGGQQEGVAHFYDSVMPKAIAKVLKQFGGQLDKSGINRPNTGFNATSAAALISEGLNAINVTANDQQLDYLVRTFGENGVDATATEAGNLFGISMDDASLFAEYLADFDTPTEMVEEQPGFDVTPEMSARAMQGMPLFQKERGMVEIADKFRRITLLEGADLTTFVHELGHTWLFELQTDANTEGAPAELVADWEIVRRWLGLAPGEEISVEAHEKFARGIEAYFMGGNAPSAVLRRVFYKVKQWMTAVYQSITGLNVQLNDDVRAVFDRLIAFDEEIDRARAANGFVQLFSKPEDVNMTEGEFAAYVRSTEDARREAQEKMVAEVAKEIEREKSAEWKENWKAVRLVEQAKAEELPVYRAIWALTHDTDADGNPIESVKLNKQAIIDMFDEPTLRRLRPGGARTGWVYAAEGGVHPDFAAKLFGMDDGRTLVQAIMDAQPMKEYVDEQTQRVMEERFGDPLDPGVIAEQAEQIVHSDRQADLLQTELKILRRAKNAADRTAAPIRAEQRQNERDARRTLDAPIPMALIREAARVQIEEMRANDVRPEHFFYAEIREGKKAQQLVLKGDYEAAADAKQKQVMNFFLYREAVRAKQDTTKIMRKAQQLMRPAAQKRIGKVGQEWLEQLNDILDRFSLITLGKAEKARATVEWAKSIREKTGEEIALSPDVINDARRTPFRELTMGELRGVYDSLLSIEHVARKLQGVYRNGVEYEREQIVEELSNSVNKMKEKPMPNLDKDLGAAASVAKMTGGFFDSVLRPEKIIERLDGGKEGIWHDLFWNQSVDAQNFRDDLRVMVMNPIIELTEQKMTKEQMAAMNDTITVQSLGGKRISRRQMIGIAFNVGNSSNLHKLQEGGIWFGQEFYKLDNSALSEILDNMQKHEWDMVQGVWDAIDQLYPYLNELNKRAVGVPLERIEPTPVQTKFGPYAGGYWPAVADPRHSKIGEEQENSDQLITGLFTQRYPKAATTHSFREERTEAAYPLQFDWERVLSNHVNKAITDIAYHEWVKQARRLLESQRVKKSIQNTMGEEVYRAMEEWLVHQVIPIHGGYSANQSTDNLQNTLISNTVVAALGFKATTALANMIVAPAQSLHQVKARYLALGIAKYLRNPQQALLAVHKLSGEMRHRFEHYEQTFNLTLAELEGKKSFRAVVARMAMMIHLHADRVSSTAIWISKYEQEIAGGKTPEEAGRLADKVIRTTQTAGAPKDLSSFERDPRYKMFKMFIGPMIIMQNEMRGAVAGKGAKALITPEVWTTMFATWIIPAVLFELVVGRGPDDDEDWYTWAARKIALYPAMTMPFIRDVASLAEAVLTGKDAQVRSNPISDVGVQLVRLAQRASKEDADMNDVADGIMRTAGVLLGLPANQAIIAKDFMVDLFSGEVDEIEDLRYLIYRRPEE